LTNAYEILHCIRQITTYALAAAYSEAFIVGIEKFKFRGLGDFSDSNFKFVAPSLDNAYNSLLISGIKSSPLIGPSFCYAFP
jgi:hypothetical protein